jgi:hypothetical protein
VAYVDSELGMLVRIRPAEATARILPALEQARGSVPVAAKRLKVCRGTLDRWVVRLNLMPAVRELLARSLPGARGKRRLGITRALARCGKYGPHKKD